MKKASLFFVIILTSLFGFSQETNISLDSAINYYRKILKKNKNSAFATASLAEAYYEKKEYQQSIDFANQNLVNKNEYLEKTFLVKGLSLNMLGKPEDAISTFNEALNNFPDNSKFLHFRAFNYYKLQDFQKSMVNCRKSIQAEPLLIENYLLYSAILFENNNNNNLVYYLLYSLLLVQEKGEAVPIMHFINTYLEKKYADFEIPFFEKRYRLKNSLELLTFYTSKISKADINLVGKELPNSLLFLDFKLEKESPIKNYYENLQKEKLEEAYVFYCLRFMENDFIKNWLLSNKDQLNKLADFLEKNMK